VALPPEQETGRVPDEPVADQRRGPGNARVTTILLASGVAVTAFGVGALVLLRTSGQSLTAMPSSMLAAVVIGIGLLLVTAGLGAYVLLPGLRGPDEARRDLGSHRLVLASTLLVIGLSNLVPVLLSLARPIEGICSVSGFLTAALGVDAALLGVTYVRFVRPGILTVSNLGLQPRELPRHISTGVFVGVFALIASAAIQAGLDQLGVRQTQLLDFRCIKGFPLAGFLAVAFAGALLAPLAEEIFFRGFVFRSYLRTRGPLVAYVASSLLFASLHLNLPALLPIMGLGLLFSAAYHRTGSIVPGIVGHALNNSFAFAILYFTDLTL
jgi:membrane protease YdiL (CAAX protease family)